MLVKLPGQHPSMAPAAAAQRADAAAAATSERMDTRLHEQLQLIEDRRAEWDRLVADPTTPPLLLEQARGSLEAEEHHLPRFVRDAREARELLNPGASREDPVRARQGSMSWLWRGWMV